MQDGYFCTYMLHTPTYILHTVEHKNYFHQKSTFFSVKKRKMSGRSTKNFVQIRLKMMFLGEIKPNVDLNRPKC